VKLKSMKCRVCHEEAHELKLVEGYLICGMCHLKFQGTYIERVYRTIAKFVRPR